MKVIHKAHGLRRILASKQQRNARVCTADRGIASPLYVLALLDGVPGLH
jgi:hypothetical protein